MQFRVYSQYNASGDITNIEDYWDEESAESDFEKRLIDSPTMYHAFLQVIDERESTAYYDTNGHLVKNESDVEKGLGHFKEVK